MQPELGLYQRLVSSYPSKTHINIWRSHAIGYPLGKFETTSRPLRCLAPSAYECEVYGSEAFFDMSRIVLEIISQLPGSVALMPIFWQTSMLGDLGQYAGQNKLPNDQDIAIVAPTLESHIFFTILKKSRFAVGNKHIPRKTTSVSVATSHWPEIPPWIQLNNLLPHKYGEQPKYRPMLEIHHLSQEPKLSETVRKFLQAYAPFYDKRKGLSVVAVTAKKTRGDDHYNIFKDYPPEFELKETVLQLIKPSPKDHTICLSAHPEPTPRLGVIGPRIGAAAVLSSIGLSERMEIDSRTIELIRASLKILTQEKRHQMHHKIQRVGEKISQAQRHIDIARKEAKCVHQNIPRIPFPESETQLLDAYTVYLRSMGYCD